MKSIRCLLSGLAAALTIAFTSRPALREPLPDCKQNAPRAKMRPRCKGDTRDVMARHSRRMAIIRHGERLSRLSANNTTANQAQRARMAQRIRAGHCKASAGIRILAACGHGDAAAMLAGA